MKKVTCTRCGARFDAAEGKCPACGARCRVAVSAPKKTNAPARTATRAKQEKRALAAGFVVAACAMLAVLTLVLCSLGGVFDFVSHDTPKMPGVVGQTETNARRMLEGLELRVEIRTEASAEAAGVVIRQSVAEGRALRSNQTVTLTVSDGSNAERVDTGEAPEETVEAPYVLGEDYDTARSRIEAQGLYLTFGGEQFNDAPEGTILSQDPAAGTRIRPGSAIRVVISLGPETKEYTVSVTVGKGGSVTPGGRVTVEEGESLQFEIVPDEGYVIKEVLVDGEDIGAVESVSFEEIDADHTLYAVFRVKTEEDETGEAEGEETRPSVSTPTDIRA